MLVCLLPSLTQKFGTFLMADNAAFINLVIIVNTQTFSITLNKIPFTRLVK